MAVLALGAGLEGSLSSGLSNAEDYHLCRATGAVSVDLTTQKQLNSQI